MAWLQRVKCKQRDYIISLTSQMTQKWKICNFRFARQTFLRIHMIVRIQWYRFHNQPRKSDNNPHEEINCTKVQNADHCWRGGVRLRWHTNKIFGGGWSTQVLEICIVLDWVAWLKYFWQSLQENHPDSFREDGVMWTCTTCILIDFALPVNFTRSESNKFRRTLQEIDIKRGHVYFQPSARVNFIPADIAGNWYVHFQP